MNSYIQLIVILFSFGYGFILYYVNIFHDRLLCGRTLFSKCIITILYCNIIALVYLLFLFKVNNGMLHFYFILSFIVGYLISSVKKRQL